MYIYVYIYVYIYIYMCIYIYAHAPKRTHAETRVHTDQTTRKQGMIGKNTLQHTATHCNTLQHNTNYQKTGYDRKEKRLLITRAKKI